MMQIVYLGNNIPSKANIVKLIFLVENCVSLYTNHCQLSYLEKRWSCYPSEPNPELIWAVSFLTDTEGGCLEIKSNRNSWESEWYHTSCIYLTVKQVYLSLTLYFKELIWAITEKWKSHKFLGPPFWTPRPITNLWFCLFSALSIRR